MQKAMQIPSREDWGDVERDLDTRYAFEVFFGKSIAEVIPQIKNAPIEVADNIRYMPPIAFRFYVLAFRDYLLSEESRDDPDAPNCYLDLIEEKLLKEPDKILTVMPDLHESVRKVAENQAFYDADLDIYDDFAQKGALIMEIYERELRSNR